MLVEFVIPKQKGRVGLQEVSLNHGDVADILDDLSDHDALYIAEDANYERCEELARGFLQLHPRQRAKTVDVLAANLSMLCSSAQGLLSSQEAVQADAVLLHKNSLRMLVHLLHVIAMQADKDAQQAQGAENAAKPKAAGRGRKAAGADDDSWDWQHSRQRVLLAVRELLLLDLKALFRGLAAAEQLINLAMELALQGLECPAVEKQESAWPACRDVLARGAVLYQQLDFVAAALMERARKHEQVPKLAALIAKHAEDKCNSTQLAVRLLAEFCRTAPEDYDAQYATNQVSVRLAGDVVACLAELQPKVVSNCISQLRPYLGCAKAYCLRGSLLAAVGSILVQVFPTDALSSSLGEGAAAAHLRSKEALLALLHERVMDKVAFVRQRVMQTWGKLVEESCVPLSHWNSLLGQAIGRLEDESQLVVKAALQLLHRMVHQGIFQPPLRPQVYLNTLRKAEAELEALLPKRQEEDEEAEGEAAGEDGAQWQPIQIKEEPVEGEQPPAAEEDADSSSPAGPSNEAAIQRLRTMCASLKEGVSFCKRLEAALPQLQLLLASPQAGVVHDVIIFLTLSKKFELPGADKALRGMWPLVFSKHEPVRQSVLDSWHILHLHDKQVKQQLEELLTQVIPGSSLSELTALECIIASLLQQGKLAASTASVMYGLMYVPALLEIGFSLKLADAWVARHACLALRYAAVHLTPSSSIQAAAVTPAGTLGGAAAASSASSSLPGSGRDAIEPQQLQQVLAALPQELLAAVLQAMFVRCKPGGSSSSDATVGGFSAAALARFFFALGRVALQHLLCIEQIGKSIRAVRLAGDRRAAEAAEKQREATAAAAAVGAGRKSSARGPAQQQQQQQDNDIGALLGAGSVAADAELDSLAEAAEAQVTSAQQLLGQFGQVLSRFCHFKALLSAPQDLQAAALLALTQLMAVDGQFCSDNAAVMFTLLLERSVSSAIRINMVVALADLASRFPNVLEPWTSRIYETLEADQACIVLPLALADLASRFPNVLEPWTSRIYETLEDPEPAVKLAALSSLTHLVLGGMVKAKGNVAKVAALLVDDEQEITERAALFFESLAKTGSGSSTRAASAAAGASAANPVYNLLPDCLSKLLENDKLREEQLQAILAVLLAYVKDKQAESLKERLVGRLALGGPREWRTVAWCIGQLGYSEKGMRRIIELTPSYRHALAEQQVFDVFMALAEKARRSTGATKAAAAAAVPESGSQLGGVAGDLRTAVEDWVADLQASRQAAVEAAEVEAAEEARRQQQQQQQQQQEDADAAGDASEEADAAVAQQNLGVCAPYEPFDWDLAEDVTPSGPVSLECLRFMWSSNVGCPNAAYK
ncbi:hypothetical protein OEZ85_005385 [Tetradesmus obliquus]|uniref:Condensin complex subunit 1 n=1 Tax=Tetradesmus obliquus TaxID=3088 RepID=A0ABY8UN74_TETOB|nr:hypothetical protein OEZ85_005385 [Tetradesmus obliquus]